MYFRNISLFSLHCAICTALHFTVSTYTVPKDALDASIRVRTTLPSRQLADTGFRKVHVPRHSARFHTRATMSQYTIVAGDTFWFIAENLGTTVDALVALNPGVVPTSLQIGQVITIPSSQPPQAQPSQSLPGQQISASQPGAFIEVTPDEDFDLTGADIDVLDPLSSDTPNTDVTPDDTQIGGKIQLPGSQGPSTSSLSFSSSPPSSNTPQEPDSGPAVTAGSTSGSSAGNSYTRFSGPASNYPSPTQWASWNDLWTANSKLMSLHNSQGENNLIGTAIQYAASQSGIDPRAILCLIVQESGGNLRVASTASWQGVQNTGIMQAHAGTVFNPQSPAASINQMVKDGTMGTQSGDGLLQCLQDQGNYYAAFRQYNSGSLGVNAKQLGDGMGATGDYVEKMANRLLGHVWDGM